MSSYVFMKALESSPGRYDRGLQILTRGRIQEVYQEIAKRIALPGSVVLDVGCGTGEVALACARLGARVEAIDINAGMLEQAIQKSKSQGLDTHINWHLLSAVEIEDLFHEVQFDAAAFCLSLSEMSPGERDYVLETIYSHLKPGGHLILADEVLPDSAFRRLAHRLRRFPWVVVTYLLTLTTTQALSGLEPLVKTKGFEVLEISRPWHGFALLFARRPATSPA